MATVRQQENGRWQAIVRRTGHPQQSKTFAREKDATNWAKAVELEMDRGRWTDSTAAEKITLGELLTRYAAEISPGKKGAPQEASRIAFWQAHRLSQRSLASVKPVDLSRFVSERQAGGAAAATIRNDLAVISNLYTVANKRWGISIANPASGRVLDLPRENNARDRRFEGDEEARLFAALEDPGDAVKAEAGDRRNIWILPMVRIAVETAMRQGELLGVEWKHVDLVRRVIHLPDTKNGTSRDVPLSPVAVAVLEKLLQPKAKSGPVFNTTASAVKQSWMRAVARARRIYEKELRDAGEEPSVIKEDPLLTDLHFHDLRHEATSRLAEVFALHELMKVTGHKDTRMLARYYHPRAEDLAKKLASR
jgi:integrase